MILRLAPLALCAALAPLAASAMGSRQEAPPLTGITCSIVATQTGDTTTFIGEVMAEMEVTGSYSMSIKRQAGNMATTSSTGGTFTARPGETAALGRSELTGDMEGVEAALTLTIGEQTMDCPLAEGAAT